MQQIKLGRNGPIVSAFGLGCMGMSGGYGPADDQEFIATVHAALEAGITMIDTGDFYGMGHNEMLIRDALKGGKRERAFIAVKCGAMRAPDLKYLGDDGRPAAVKNFLSYSLRRLGTDYIDLYQPSRVDPAVPIEDTIGAIAEMVKAGYVRHIGVSEASAKTLRRAHAVHPIAALQIEYSLFSRGIEREILPDFARAWHRAGRLWRAVRRTDQRPRRSGEERGKRNPHPQAAFLRREFRQEHRAGRSHQKDRKRKRRNDCSNSPLPG